MKLSVSIIITLLSLTIAAPAASARSVLAGSVSETATGEPVIGASVRIDGGSLGAVTDIDGRFTIPLGRPGTHTWTVEMISYKAASGSVTADVDTVWLDVSLDYESAELGEVVVSGVRRFRSEAATVDALRTSLTVASAVSGEAIRRTADKDASEVIRRMAGVAVINDRFIVARGLSQRYNNVWVNGVAMPSSEPDTRSFSFDLIPSGQIDNIMVFKSPAPELPADFSGGFVRLLTRDNPEAAPLNISLTGGYNTATSLRDFRYNPGRRGAWLGLASTNGDNWRIDSRRALPEMKLSASYGREWTLPSGDLLTLNSALNYSYADLRYADMDNARYGRYNTAEDRPEYLYKYTDNRWQSSVRWGAMLNMAWKHGTTTLHLRNIFNQLGQNRLTERSGWQNISSRYDQEKTEYLYNARSTYVGQLAGTTTLSRGKISWTAAYTYANRRQPDRRIIDRQQNDLYGDPHFGMMQIDQNSIQRDYSDLDEHVVSVGSDYDLEFDCLGLRPTLKTGIFGQYRTRDYRQTALYYRYNEANLPDGFSYLDPISEILIPTNMGPDRLYLYDGTDRRDSYSGHEQQAHAYAALNLPLGRWDVYAGLRLEQSRMTLRTFTTLTGSRTADHTYSYLNLFPSVNTTWNPTPAHKLRLAYGMTTNRPEFREVSPSVYYDFELFSDIKGNPSLKAALIQNLDLRWEWYPGAAETVSAGVFYKHFSNPVENTFLDAGGSYTYTFENADRADVYGIELDVRKSLAFIGMPWLQLGFNGALIKSRVRFADGSLEHDRPMQGQSPYLVNASLFYRPDGGRFTAGALYNRIGKRIVGIGRTDISSGGTIDNDIPDMYEMPRDVLDLVAGYTLSDHVELKLSARDILGSDVEFCQFPHFTASDGATVERRQVTRRFNPGRTFQITVSIKL